jgi:F-type H+-transporting ATPase subunit gamma
MLTLKEVRTRISSVESTEQITSAMKMVAASKLRKAQNAILKLRPYASKLQEILLNLTKSFENTDENVFSEIRTPEKILLIVIASNRGLCGPFNANIIKATNNLIATKYNEQNKAGNLNIYCFGKKVSEYYEKNNYKVLATNNEIFSDLTFENTVPVAESLMKDFAEKKYDKIEIIYDQFKNAAVQRLIIEQYLPIVLEKEETIIEKESFIDFIFEPGKKDIIRELIPKSLKIQLYKALLDSFASEHGARMTAMHMATDNVFLSKSTSFSNCLYHSFPNFLINGSLRNLYSSIPFFSPAFNAVSHICHL